MSATADLELIDSGLGVTLQDRGRHGWRRWGVPLSGPMDPHAAGCANRLLENDSKCAVLEILSQGAKFRVLRDVWMGICGAASLCTIPTWRAHYAQAGELVAVKQCASGLWSYLAIEGGFAAEMVFGSASFYARGGLGKKLEKGAMLERQSASRFRLAAGISARFASWTDRWDYNQPPRISVYPGPQWRFFSVASRDSFLTQEWKISPQSDRVGYRLEGVALKAEPVEILSEPVRLGSVQVPENGQPIITMPDGPAVGGYPKIAVIDPAELARIAQCRPGQTVRFQLGS